VAAGLRFQEQEEYIMEASLRKQVPIRQGMMVLPSASDEKGHLLGSRCRHCDELFFIERQLCENCQSRDLETVRLSDHGKLYAFSVMYYPAPPPYKAPEPFVPYAAGWIELPEGLVLYSLLTENDPDKLRVGMDMELVIEKFDNDEQGNDLMVCRFRPV
jgi:uncharacterized OB-fold protein